ncbi:MAG: Hpt domain-containing protein [bacterium]|nr:Hpt domain-containing protein [bacterium]
MPETTIDSMLSGLRRSYLEALPGKLETLKQAVATLDFAELIRIGHQLKGSGRSYGFAPISDLGARIEQAAYDRRQALLEPILIEFRELIQQLSEVSEPMEKP